MSELLPIGRFGKEAQLTPRQLRYYHALGLLVPAAVDPGSGYRYYPEAQLATAELIALLRSVDMPLAEIQALLADRSVANVHAAFARLRTSVEARLDRARQILDRIIELEEAAMPSEAKKASYAYEAFTPEAQQALLRAQSLAEEARHPVIAVAHLMAAVASELGSSEAAIMEVLGPGAEGAGQPMPGPEVQAAIAGAFRAAAVVAPGSAESGVGLKHLARGCLETPDGRAISDRLGLTGVS